MSNIDQYYTPRQISENMIKHGHKGRKSYIADFAAGHGELLKVAQKRWQQSTIIATDVCRNTVSFLTRNEPSWIVGKCNFLDVRSRNRCKALKGMLGKVDLILLNPPFSCRGGTRFISSIENRKIRCSQALAFLIHSIPFLSIKGQIIAILPTGCIQSEKDELALHFLKKVGKIDIVGKNGHKAFSGSSARSVIVCFTLSNGQEINNQDSKPSIIKNLPRDIKINLKIYRGKIRVNTINNESSNGGYPFIHSTELSQNDLNLSRRRIKSKYLGINGPAVLLPRVGNPNKSKVSVYKSQDTIVLSDCVIALQCKTVRDAKITQKILMEHWSIIEKNYIGTCARYITINSLLNILNSFGFHIAS